MAVLTCTVKFHSIQDYFRVVSFSAFENDIYNGLTWYYDIHCISSRTELYLNRIDDDDDLLNTINFKASGLWGVQK